MLPSARGFRARRAPARARAVGLGGRRAPLRLGAGFTTWTANANAGVQLEAPDHLRGRVIGLYFYAFNGAGPLGGLLAGWLCARAGPSSRSPSAGSRRWR